MVLCDFILYFIIENIGADPQPTAAPLRLTPEALSRLPSNDNSLPSLNSDAAAGAGAGKYTLVSKYHDYFDFCCYISCIFFTMFQYFFTHNPY